MYNLDSHYENIFHALKDIITHRRVFYLLPYGSSSPNNVESITDDLNEVNNHLRKTRRPPMLSDGPLLFFYDQEPILGEYNHELFAFIRSHRGPVVLVSTEKDSDPLTAILDKFKFKSVYYFHHAFAAHDWFRGAKYDRRLIPPAQRSLKKKYITFNRITSNARVYRTLFLSELIDRYILDQGHISWSEICPDNKQGYEYNLDYAVQKNLMSNDLVQHVKQNIQQLPKPLRVDYDKQLFIPNTSFKLSAVEQTQESFLYVVTETCYWERKCHLTEKIFKPIVSRMPFVLVGCAHNLAYLRSYGFKTFSKWIDETYDTIEDPIERMHAIGLVLLDISNRSLDDLQAMLLDMNEVIEHNYNWFYSQDFLDLCWNELFDNIKSVTAPD